MQQHKTHQTTHTPAPDILRCRAMLLLQLARAHTHTLASAWTAAMASLSAEGAAPLGTLVTRWRLGGRAPSSSAALGVACMHSVCMCVCLCARLRASACVSAASCALHSGASYTHTSLSECCAASCALHLGAGYTHTPLCQRAALPPVPCAWGRDAWALHPWPE
eukprot:1161713-Pelagomonas_calceolata.AAC.3